MQRLENKILFLIIAVLLAVFGGIVYVVTSGVERYFLEQEREKVAMLASTIHQTLDKDMVAFRADIVRHLIKDLQDLEGILRLQIVRGKDGRGVEEAFQDFKTLRDVETRIPLRPEWVRDHPDRTENIADGVDHPRFREIFAQMLKDPFSAQDRVYFETIGGEPALTYLRPLPNFQQCYLCHGSDHELRGVLMISASLTPMLALVSESRQTIFWFGLGTLALVGAILKLGMYRVVTSPVRELAGAIEGIAEGEADLTRTVPVRSRDELGRVASGFNRFAQKLRALVNRLKDGAAQVTRSVQEVLANTVQITEGSETQARAVESVSRTTALMNDLIRQVAEKARSLSVVSEESSAAVSQISQSIQQIAGESDLLSRTVETVSVRLNTLVDSSQEIRHRIDQLLGSAENTAASSGQMNRVIGDIRQHVQASVGLSEQVEEDAREGERSVAHALDRIHRIEQYSEEIRAVIHRLQTRTVDIGKILEVIAEVAEQTDLLALNAAIIAAQSGEQGKGFSVVAREIKELAERTAASTQEIHEIINALQQEGDRAVHVIEAGVGAVREGVVSSESVRDALHKVIESARHSARQIGEIAKATEGQAMGVQQVVSAIQQVSDMIRDISRSTAEQAEGSRWVIEKMKLSRQISDRVRLATQEQAKGNQQIQRLVEDVNNRVREIVSITQDQQSQCAEILSAVAEVQHVAEANMDAVGRVGYVAEQLLKESMGLEEAIGRFKTEREGNADSLSKL